MKDWFDAFGVLHLGWTVAFLLLIPTGIGVFLDRRLGTAPWATLIGAVIGTGVATFGVTRMILQRYDRLAPPETKEEDR